MVTTLEEASTQAIKWFSLNKMKANPSKFQALYLNRSSDTIAQFNINNSIIHSDESVKLLGVLFDRKLSFDEHISNITKKAGKQINGLRRISSLLSTDSKLKIFNSFIYSNFTYCPIVYNTFFKKHGHKLEKLQERALRFVFNDFTSTYSDLLNKSGKKELTVILIRSIAEQVYKVLNDKAKPIDPSFFKRTTSPYSLRYQNKLMLPSFKTIKYGKYSFKYMGAFIWNSLPEETKRSVSLDEFKEKIKDWAGTNCKCSSCFFCSSKCS